MSSISKEFDGNIVWPNEKNWVFLGGGGGTLAVTAIVTALLYFTHAYVGGAVIGSLATAGALSAAGFGYGIYAYIQRCKKDAEKRAEALRPKEPIDAPSFASTLEARFAPGAEPISIPELNERVSVVMDRAGEFLQGIHDVHRGVRRQRAAVRPRMKEIDAIKQQLVELNRSPEELVPMLVTELALTISREPDLEKILKNHTFSDRKTLSEILQLTPPDFGKDWLHILEGMNALELTEETRTLLQNVRENYGKGRTGKLHAESLIYLLVHLVKRLQVKRQQEGRPFSESEVSKLIPPTITFACRGVGARFQAVRDAYHPKGLFSKGGINGALLKGKLYALKRLIGSLSDTRIRSFLLPKIQKYPMKPERHEVILTAVIGILRQLNSALVDGTVNKSHPLRKKIAEVVRSDDFSFEVATTDDWKVCLDRVADLFERLTTRLTEDLVG